MNDQTTSLPEVDIKLTIVASFAIAGVIAIMWWLAGYDYQHRNSNVAWGFVFSVWAWVHFTRKVWRKLVGEPVGEPETPATTLAKQLDDQADFEEKESEQDRGARTRELLREAADHLRQVKVSA